MAALDDIDRRIVAALQAEGRLPIVDLANRVGLSPTPCQRRVKRLEDEGVIARYAALVPPQALGLGLQALVQITLDDQGGRESIIIETPGGQKLTLEDGPGAVVLTDSNGNSVELKTNGITVNAASRVILNASAVEVNAGVVSVSAAISKFGGVVQCDTLISNSVVSQSYTPGAGNIW